MKFLNLKIVFCEKDFLIPQLNSMTVVAVLSFPLCLSSGPISWGATWLCENGYVVFHFDGNLEKLNSENILEHLDDTYDQMAPYDVDAQFVFVSVTVLVSPKMTEHVRCVLGVCKSSRLSRMS